MNNVVFLEREVSDKGVERHCNVDFFFVEEISSMMISAHRKSIAGLRCLILKAVRQKTSKPLMNRPKNVQKTYFLKYVFHVFHKIMTSPFVFI